MICIFFHCLSQLVLDVPSAPKDFERQGVLAIFYVKQGYVIIDEAAKRIAQREAKRTGKPLLFIDKTRGFDTYQEDHDEGSSRGRGDLFQCESNYEWESREAGISATYLRGKPLLK